MQELINIEISTSTAPSDVLNDVLVDSSRTRPLLHRLLSHDRVREAFVLTTCERLEVYVMAEPPIGRLLPSIVHDLGLIEHTTRLRTRRGPDAAEHLFRVTSGLESRRVGEVEIQAQVRGSIARCRDAGSLGPQLDVLLRHTVQAARAVRKACGLTDVPALAQLVADQLPGRGDDGPHRVTIVGSGILARSMYGVLTTRGCHVEFCTSRTESLREQYGPDVSVHPRGELDRLATEAHAVVLATRLGDRIVDGPRALDWSVRRGGRPLVLVDLGSPATHAASDVRDQRSIRVVGLADLERTHGLATPLAATQSLLEKAQGTIAQEVADYVTALKVARSSHVITELRDHVSSTVEEEIERVRATVSDREVVERLGRNLAATLLHPITLALKDAIGQDDLKRVATIRAAFGLTEDADPPRMVEAAS